MTSFIILYFLGKRLICLISFLRVFLALVEQEVDDKESYRHVRELGRLGEIRDDLILTRRLKFIFLLLTKCQKIKF